MVDLLLTVESCIPHWTLAEVASLRVVGAAATIETRAISTSVRTQLTVVAVETRWACALVAIFIVSAAASIAARISRAFIDLNLTAGTSETWQAGAGVATLTSISTGRSVQAGFVVSAVI